MGNIISSGWIKQPAVPAETSSTCVTESVTGAHNFRVTNYLLLNGMGVRKFVSSSTFRVDGYDWNITFYPDGKTAAGYAAVFLCLFGEAIGGVKVKLVFSLLGKDGKAYGDYKPRNLMPCTFGSGSNSWGLQDFIQKSKLQDDCFTIRCDVTVIKEHRTEAVGAIVVPVPPSNVQKQFGNMLKDGTGADVTFIVGDGQLFRAHRCVLAARSPVFMAELFGQMKENTTGCIMIDDMEPSIFEALLHFIYTDSLPDNWDVNKNGPMQHLLVAADRYGLDRLRAMCEAKLCQNIDVESVATTLTLAEQHQCVQLKNACLGFMSSRTVLAAVIKTDGFKHLITSCPSVMMEILYKEVSLSSGV